ncbi:MAG: Spermidine/putrescine import ABC transporter substrate-binding protein PotD, partial [uncultured Rubrobacteraceae bacterium]
GDRPAPRVLGPPVGRRVRGQDVHAQRLQGDARGRPLQDGPLRQHHGHGRAPERRGRAQEAEAAPARLLRLDGGPPARPERRPPARARLQRRRLPGALREPRPRLRGPEARRHPLDGQHVHPQRRRAPAERPQVHKLHPGREDGGRALQLHLLQHPERGGAADDRRRAQGPPWLRPPRQRLREAAGDRGPGRGDARVRAPLHRSEELL